MKPAGSKRESFIRELVLRVMPAHAGIQVQTPAPAGDGGDACRFHLGLSLGVTTHFYKNNFVIRNWLPSISPQQSKRTRPSCS